MPWPATSSELPEGALNRQGWSELAYSRIDETAAGNRTALVRVSTLDGGFRLLVGVDLEEQRRVRAIMSNAALWSAAFIIVLGVAGGWFRRP